MLEDGEYDIDLLALWVPSEATGPVNNSNNAGHGQGQRLWNNTGSGPSSTTTNTTTGSVAIRYGFIPEGMDSKGPLTMYFSEQEWLLQASSTDKKPIIFEGLEQHLSSLGGDENDSYYFVYDPKNTPNQIQLKPLSTAIRFNKSRNAQRLQKRIQKWHDDNEGNTTVGGDGNRQSTTLIKSPPKIQREQPRQHSSLKRPPVKKTDSNIISESDFEDLDEEEEGEDVSFPVFEIKDDDDTKEPPAKPKASRKPIANKQLFKTRKKDSLEDDFKDLEDQLAEVLEDEEIGDDEQEQEPEKDSDQEKATEKEPEKEAEHVIQDQFNSSNGLSHEFDSDSDEDGDSDNNNNSASNTMPVASSVLLINDGEDDEKPVTKTPSAFEGAFDSAKKPMSLRQLIGGGSNDEEDNLSMSEEE